MNENVMEFIELELTKDPGVSNATLFEGAKLIDRTIGKLNPRQFHAKYPLQVKRRLAGAGPGRAVRASARPKAAQRPRAAKGDADAVRAYVERVLKRNPGVTNAELFAGACEIDASIADLSPRQFHAKYPLQVKRRLAAAEAPKPAPRVRRTFVPAVAEPAPAAAPAAAAAPAMGGGDAAAVRGLLLSLVRELANAETQAETIEVMARLDGYVSDVMQAARS